MNLTNRMAGLFLTVTIMLLTSACQNRPVKQADNIANLCHPQSEPDSESCKWANEMQHQLNHHFQDAARYAGQQCLVRLEWQSAGRYAVTQTQGDEALCLRAWQLIGQAKTLPPPPDRRQPAWFGFAPRQALPPAQPAATDARG